MTKTFSPLIMNTVLLVFLLYNNTKTTIIITTTVTTTTTTTSNVLKTLLKSKSHKNRNNYEHYTFDWGYQALYTNSVVYNNKFLRLFVTLSGFEVGVASTTLFTMDCIQVVKTMWPALRLDFSIFWVQDTLGLGEPRVPLNFTQFNSLWDGFKLRYIALKASLLPTALLGFQNNILFRCYKLNMINIYLYLMSVPSCQIIWKM